MTASRPELQSRLRGSTSASVWDSIPDRCSFAPYARACLKRSSAVDPSGPLWGCFFGGGGACTRSWKPPEAWRSSDCGEPPEQSSHTADIKEKEEVCWVGWLARLEERKTAPVSPVFVRYWCVCVCVFFSVTADTFIVPFVHGGRVVATR